MEAGSWQSSDYPGNKDDDLEKRLVNELQRQASATVKQGREKRTRAGLEIAKHCTAQKQKGRGQTPKII